VLATTALRGSHNVEITSHTRSQSPAHSLSPPLRGFNI
jgi:hypothetical protein